MDVSPYFSIILPIYNVEQYIDECLSSLTNQTFQNIEILCVIDGSPDRSYEICEMYAKKDARVHVIYQDNQGASCARNRGLRQATGKYIHFVDPDDRIHNADVYAKLYAELSKRDVDVMVVGSVYYENTFDNYVKNGEVRDEEKIGSNSLKFILENNYFFALTSGVNKLYKRELLIKHDLYWPLNVTNEDDRWLPQVMNKSESIVFLPLHIYDVRRRGGSLTSIKSTQWLYNRARGYCETALMNCQLIKHGNYGALAQSNGFEYYIQLYFGALKQCRDNGGTEKGDLSIIDYMQYVKNWKMCAVYSLSKLFGKKFAFYIMKRRYNID